MITESQILEAINKLHAPYAKSKKESYQKLREEMKKQVRFLKEELQDENY